MNVTTRYIQEIIQWKILTDTHTQRNLALNYWLLGTQGHNSLIDISERAGEAAPGSRFQNKVQHIQVV